MFNFKIEGLDEAIKQLNDMKHGLTEQGLNESCNKVKNEANKICGLTNQDLKLQAKKTGDKINIDFSLKDRKQLHCIKKAIEKMLSTMPITTKAFFEQLLKKIDEELKDQSNN